MSLQPLQTPGSLPQAEPAITEKLIVQAALEILDEAGFDRLTMRTLAAKLGIKAASLYWHVRNKQDLLGMLAEEICASMEEPDPAISWQERLVFLGREYRRVLESHRDAGRVLLASGIPNGPNRLRITEMVLRTLLEAGLADKDAAYAALLMNDYVTMFVLDEAQYADSEGTDNPTDSANPSPNWQFALSPVEYPSVVALINYLAKPDMSERFQIGIEILLKGLEARLPGGIK